MIQHEAETNKAIVHRLYQAFKAGDVAALGEVLAEDFINHNPRTTNGLTASRHCSRRSDRSTRTSTG